MAPDRYGLAAEFAAAMDRSGPFEPNPALAVAVSGGADSMALALLAREWAARRAGSILGLAVDHGLRPESANEARITAERLAHQGIPARLLVLSNLIRGSALAERARIMRYDILSRTCREAGILHLLLGHHAGDQVETLAMRVLRGSGTHGLACMPLLRETAGVRLLRPLLGMEPGSLREFLIENRVEWIEDPSNQDMRALRPRLRKRFATRTAANDGVLRAVASAGRLRSREEAAIAAELALRATIRQEGFALLAPDRIGSGALSALVRTIGGAAYPPNPSRIAELAARIEPVTLAGVRIVPAGRFGEGMLILREEAAIEKPVEARPDTFWDNRFRLIGSPPAGATIGKLGDDAARFRRSSGLPASVLRTLPAIRIGKSLAAVPHLGYGDNAGMMVLFAPPRPLAGPCFLPAA